MRRFIAVVPFLILCAAIVGLSFQLSAAKSRLDHLEQPFWVDAIEDGIQDWTNSIRHAAFAVDEDDFEQAYQEWAALADLNCALPSRLAFASATVAIGPTLSVEIISMERIGIVDPPRGMSDAIEQEWVIARVMRRYQSPRDGRPTILSGMEGATGMLWHRVGDKWWTLDHCN